MQYLGSARGHMSWILLPCRHSRMRGYASGCLGHSWHCMATKRSTHPLLHLLWGRNTSTEYCGGWGRSTLLPQNKCTTLMLFIRDVHHHHWGDAIHISMHCQSSDTSKLLLLSYNKFHPYCGAVWFDKMRLNVMRCSVKEYDAMQFTMVQIQKQCRGNQSKYCQILVKFLNKGIGPLLIIIYK